MPAQSTQLAAIGRNFSTESAGFSAGAVAGWASAGQGPVCSGRLREAPPFLQTAVIHGDVRVAQAHQDVGHARGGRAGAAVGDHPVGVQDWADLLPQLGQRPVAAAAMAQRRHRDGRRR